MANFLKRAYTRLRVKATEVPLTVSGLDVISLPEGHLSCPKCQSPYFEAWPDLENHFISAGCTRCGWSTKLLFPVEISLAVFDKTGRWKCVKHSGENVFIKNADMFCVGCRYCRTQAVVKLVTKGGLILAS